MNYVIQEGSTVIDVQHLTKRYGRHLAVDDLSFHVDAGMVYGFLGPNGAGKSTTMNIMTGSLAATSGEVKIAGYDIFDDAREVKKLIGYLPEMPPLYLSSTPKEYLKFVGHAKGFLGAQLKKHIDRAMQITHIEDVANRLIGNLSKGYRQRVGVAQAILGNPKVIILDEPTVGLDPRQIIEIRDLISELGKEHTVILSSHILSEVQAICEKILIISKGKLVACDTPDNLERQFKGSAMVNLVAEASEKEIRQILMNTSVKEIRIVSKDKGKTNVRLEYADLNNRSADDICRETFLAFSHAGRPILQMNVNQANLEDIFIELTKQ